METWVHPSLPSRNAEGNASLQIAFSNSVLYTQGVDNGALTAIDAATGTRKWSVSIDGEYFSPLSVANGVIYVGSKELNALDAATGVHKWSVVLADAVQASPLVVNGVVYVLSYNGRL